ncbi:MAG: acyl-CoA dehydrogenase family protein, partial [Chloroflexi bacterium]|nr:acyl-CoA dehydrogenase family protein [Chloroflexota bacterium]
MDFELSEQHLALRAMVRDFAEKEIAPVAQHLDQSAQFPYDLVRQMGSLGIMGIPFPEGYGGSGA